MSEDVKPCPWCKTNKDINVYRPMQVASTDRRCVECKGCGCTGPYTYDNGEAAAIAAWNDWTVPVLPDEVVDLFIAEQPYLDHPWQVLFPILRNHQHKFQSLYFATRGEAREAVRGAVRSKEETS